MRQKITTAQRFRAARIRAGLSVIELAQKSGVAERTIRYIETGATATPQMSTVRAIAEALGVGMTDLIGEEVAA